jgi:hypothetical protein
MWLDMIEEPTEKCEAARLQRFPASQTIAAAPRAAQ